MEEEKVPEKIPLPFKIFGIINILLGIAAIPLIVSLIISIIDYVNQYLQANNVLPFTALILAGISIALVAALMVMYIIVGIKLLRDKKRFVSQLAYIMIVISIVSIVLTLCIDAAYVNPIVEVINLAYLVVLATYIDPSLSDERRVQRTLRDMETRTDAEEGTLGRDKTGKGYIKLDFFNMFWICVVGCVVGVLFETVYVGVTTGVWHNRAGLLWGPFSPIFGIGALLMTIALNRFYKKNIFVNFLVSAFIGAAFEYFVSWFLQAAFGIVAWDYSNNFLNINGRVDFFHFMAWGLLGACFTRLLMPLLLKIVNLIPWKWRYSVTTVFAIFMLVNAMLTLVAFDRWTGRLSNIAPTTAVEAWVDEQFPNDWMQNRFQSMSINPENANNMENTSGKLNGPAGTT